MPVYRRTGARGDDLARDWLAALAGRAEDAMTDPGQSVSLNGVRKGDFKHDQALKVWPAYFEDTYAGRKTFEIRRRDGREFAQGERLLLREWASEPAQGRPPMTAPGESIAEALSGSLSAVQESVTALENAVNQGQTISAWGEAISAIGDLEYNSEQLRLKIDRMAPDDA